MAATTRRDFVKKAVQVGTLAGLGDFAFLQDLRPVSAQEAHVPPGKVRLTADIEPLVSLIEDTPRDQLLSVIGGRVHQGLDYQQLLAALLLAGVRSIQPRPVGFKFHAVLVVNSAHLASLAAPDRDRWLPLFWALDNFKSSQTRNQQEGNWSMPPVKESALPPAEHARQRFVEAMDNWDVDGADTAVAALVRNAGATEVIELFWRYGARDFRDIGHKAIFAANSWRTLQTIGWRHAEPVMRSLAYAMLEHKENGNPAKLDAEPDRPWRENIRRAKNVRAHWQQGKVDPKAAEELLAELRTASAGGAGEHVVRLLNKGIDPASVWDGIFLAAGEWLMRQPGILGIHCVTSINALHYAYQTSGDDETRRMMMLQAAAFLPLFRKAMAQRGRWADGVGLDGLEKAELHAQGPEALEEIFAEVSKDRQRAAQKTLTWLETKGNDPHQLMTAARRLIFTKGSDSHDYKFSSAALEDFYHTTGSWRDRYLAASMFNLKGSEDPDNGLMKRTQAALGG